MFGMDAVVFMTLAQLEAERQQRQRANSRAAVQRARKCEYCGTIHNHEQRCSSCGAPRRTQ
jgi:rubrerythrin